MYRIAYLLLLPMLAATTRLAPRVTPVEQAVPMRTGSGTRALSIKPVRWSVVGPRVLIEAVAGRGFGITLQADIAKGWHIYSMTQKPGGPIPLSINLIDAGDVTMRGVVRAPKPERYFDKNFGMETELYSGSPRFTIPVAVPGRSTTGTRKIQLGARYQVCSATLCLPARTDKLDVTLHVVGRK